MAKNWAIAIGINHYEFLQPLQYAKHDAEAIGQFLIDELACDRLFLFTNDSPDIHGKSTRPYRSNLLRVFRQIFATSFLGDGDTLWFFFSGHGIRHEARDYLMPLDGDPENVEETGISTHDITDHLRMCGADNVVMILDACRSQGQKAGEGMGRFTEERARQTGIISIFSCSPSQYSYEVDALGHGVFTTALLEGLGAKEQCATVTQLNQFLEIRVPELLQNHHHGRVRQVPYIIAEPVERSHTVLVPRYATPTDIALLKTDAYQAEISNDTERALRLWIRVLATVGQDMEVVQAIQRIGNKATPIPLNSSSENQIKILPISAYQHDFDWLLWWQWVLATIISGLAGWLLVLTLRGALFGVVLAYAIAQGLILGYRYSFIRGVIWCLATIFGGFLGRQIFLAIDPTLNLATDTTHILVAVRLILGGALVSILFSGFQALTFAPKWLQVSRWFWSMLGGLFLGVLVCGAVTVGSWPILEWMNVASELSWRIRASLGLMAGLTVLSSVSGWTLVRLLKQSPYAS